MVSAMSQITVTASRYCLLGDLNCEALPELGRIRGNYLEVIAKYGQEIATHRSIEMAISVLTEAETETPCIYDTVLQKNEPNVHSEMSIKSQLVSCQITAYIVDECNFVSSFSTVNT